MLAAPRAGPGGAVLGGGATSFKAPSRSAGTWPGGLSFSLSLSLGPLLVGLLDPVLPPAPGPRCVWALASMLLTGNNLAYYQSLMAGMRAAIEAGGFADFAAATKAGWARGDLPPFG